MSERTALLVGTRKGLFVLDGDAERETWTVRGPLCDGWPIHDAIVDPATGAIFAGGGSNWYGPAVWRSDDLGETWSHSSEGMTYGDDGEKIATIWSLATGPGDAMYAGVEPAGLFRSDDRGATWQHVEGLTNHPSRPEWQPGNGGLILHSIVPSPATRTACGSGSRPWARSRPPTAARPGRPGTPACGRGSCPRASSTRTSASACTSS